MKKAYRRNGLLYYATAPERPKLTTLQRVKEVTKANTPKRKVLWTDLPPEVLEILKQAGIYPPKPKRKRDGK
jgi:hypothetical protein